MNRKKQLVCFILALSLVFTCVFPAFVSAETYKFGFKTNDKVTFVPGDTGMVADATNTFDTENDEEKTLPTAEMTGYGFNGWAYKNSGSIYSDTATKVINSDWVENSGFDETPDYDYSNKSFWFYPVFGRTVVWNFENGDTENPSYSEFIAGWTFEGYDGSGITFDLRNLWVAKKDMNSFGDEEITKKYHTFSHWSDTPNGSNDVFAAEVTDDGVPPEETVFYFGSGTDITTAIVNLYAVWNETSHDVYYLNVFDGIENPNPTTYKDSVVAEEPIELADIEKDGYYFKGWYTASGLDNGTKTEKITDETAEEEDLYLTAGWKYKLKDEYVKGRVGKEITPLTLELADETLTDARITLGDDQILPAGITFKDGVLSGKPTEKFKGTVKFTVTPDRDDGVYVEGPEVTFNITKNTGNSGTTGSSSFTVKFNTNGADPIKSQSVKRNATVTEPEAPVKEGSEFAGWYTDEKLTKEYDFSTKVLASFTLYAKWEAEEEPATDDTDTDDGILFDDVSKDDWFYDDVKFANDNGLMFGISDGKFAPNAIITRGMFITVIYRLEGSPEVEKTAVFEDIDLDAYYADAVIWGKQNKLVKGISDTEYAPDDNVTREQIATIMRRYGEFKGDASAVNPEFELTYADTDKVSDFAVSGVKYCTLKGIMSGKSNNMFAPADSTMRAEIAAILRRFMNLTK